MTRRESYLYAIHDRLDQDTALTDPGHVWMGFQIVGVFLASFSLSSGAYRSPFKSEHHQRHLPPEALASHPPPLSPIRTLTLG